MKKVKFEEALNRLEKIVKQFEENELGLEESLKLFEEGIKLSAICQDKLNEVSKKIEILTKFNEDGSLEKKTFEVSGEI
ncbi:exodeoxyribonuclease VII small subunit [bacterium]|nr:exodeoxyribonuclease VII small subunit [bacterium]MBU1154160.1 exodeoxyribonuclease VII small subunit [bacterium]MBU1782183.1 exodeoxyribonuclease VII small subunit [bacterium]MBU2599517.1 exodeoxyribonuclease VII small subunit [bacterium]